MGVEGVLELFGTMIESTSYYFFVVKFQFANIVWLIGLPVEFVQLYNASHVVLTNHVLHITIIVFFMNYMLNDELILFLPDDSFMHVLLTYCNKLCLSDLCTSLVLKYYIISKKFVMSEWI